MTVGSYWDVQKDNKEGIQSTMKECIDDVTISYAKGMVGDILKGSENISSSSAATIAKLISGWSLRDVSIIVN